MRRIKRTKITVIRTETVFLRKVENKNDRNYLQIQTEDLPETEKADSTVEIETIIQIENIEKR